ncbi:hypothetical protein OAQ84_00830, partial [Bdellovibrionales bacterium]|nr:hypothetical protein [Bdellovibrionales bacterium]
AAAGEVFESSNDCLSKERVTRFVKELNIYRASFPDEELCDSDNELNQLYRSLMMMEDGQFSGEGDSQFIGDWVSRGRYYSWTERRIYRIRRAHDIPYATAYNSGGNITVQDGWAQLSSLGKVGVLIHEARHTDGYRHRPCRQGPYRGVSVAGCDESVASGGSHSIEMEYYARVLLEGQNFHPVYQSMARLMLLARSHFVFNQQPLQKSSTLYLRGVNGETFLYSHGSFIRQFPLQGYSGWRLKRGSMGPVLFNGRQALAIDIYDSQVAPQKDEFSYYKLLGLNPPEPFLDMEEIDDGETKYVMAIGQSGRLYQYQFRRSQWAVVAESGRFLGFKTRSRSDEEGLYVVSEGGELFRWQFGSGELESLTEKWPQNIVSYAEMEGALVELRSDGQLYLSQSGQLVEGLPLISEIVEVPQYEENVGGEL